MNNKLIMPIQYGFVNFLHGALDHSRIPGYVQFHIYAPLSHLEKINEDITVQIEYDEFKYPPQVIKSALKSLHA